MPAPIAPTVTDADGYFALIVPEADDFLIFARIVREVGLYPYRHAETDEWRIKSPDIDDKDLFETAICRHRR